MKFQPGNQLWKVRNTHGRNRLYARPQALWSRCCEYFEWSDNNPLWEHKAFAYKGESWVEKVPKLRAYTQGALCIFLGISNETWTTWRKEGGNRAGFSEVVAKVDEIIRTQKFQGASADLLNSNIIARDLGLTDKQQVESHNTTTTVNLDAEQYAKVRQQMLKDDNV